MPSGYVDVLHYALDHLVRRGCGRRLRGQLAGAGWSNEGWIALAVVRRVEASRTEDMRSGYARV